MLILPTEDQTPITDWSSVLHELKRRLNGSEKDWQPQTAVHLMAKERLLDGRQLQTIAEALSQFELQLKLVCTSRRQTAVAAVTAGYSVQQQPLKEHLTSKSSEEEPQELAEPLYLQTTVRSGVEVRHPGTVIISGDVNPGGTVIATGDIVIWGRLRGIAHAGAQGNTESRIMALKMEPTQLRIADRVARAPKSPLDRFTPEVAYITSEGIRLTNGMDFLKTHSFSMEVGAWTDSQNKQLTTGK